jgi:hypothetical protein
MSFSVIYVASRRLEFARPYKSKLKGLFISVRCIISAFLFYTLIIGSSIIYWLIYHYVELLTNSTYWVYFVVWDVYYLPLFFIFS